MRSKSFAEAMTVRGTILYVPARGIHRVPTFLVVGCQFHSYHVKLADAENCAQRIKIDAR